jgi:3-methyladenine DNA glycosylase/8-oxoguanine DNA glycosylase
MSSIVAPPRPAAAELRRVWQAAMPIDVRRTLGPLQRGSGDPTMQVRADGSVWRTSRMPAGAVTYRVEQTGAMSARCTAWGPGAAELLDGLPDLLGARDDHTDFVPGHPLLESAHRRLAGLRTTRTARVLEALVPAILEQKILTVDAWAAWRRLLRRFGEAAPGPAGDDLRVVPDALGWARIASWDWHRAGVDPRRMRAVQVALPHAAKLERAALTNPAELSRLLLVLPGIGVWTAAQVASRAVGDADALPIGDFHLPATGHALIGRRFADDEVEEAFEAWRPHRYRVWRLLGETPGSRPARRAPLLSRVDHRAI